MEHLVALPQYDVLAYLIVGLAAIAACDLIYRKRVFFRGDWGISVGSTIVIAAYVVGHIIAVFSTVVIEGYIVGPWMAPVVHLMAQPCDKSDGSRLSYFAPLECNTQNKIKEKIKRDDKNRTLEGSILFWEAYNTAKQDEHAFERIVTFHQLYNFSRNMSFASFLAAVAVLIQLFRRRTASENNTAVEYGLPAWLQNRGWQFIAFLFVGCVLFSRYLYFYRAHTIEILTSYAYGH